MSGVMNVKAISKSNGATRPRPPRRLEEGCDSEATEQGRDPWLLGGEALSPLFANPERVLRSISWAGIPGCGGGDGNRRKIRRESNLDGPLILLILKIGLPWWHSG